MPQMTFLALLVLHGGMDAFHAEVFVAEFCMTIEAVLAREPLVR